MMSPNRKLLTPPTQVSEKLFSMTFSVFWIKPRIMFRQLRLVDISTINIYIFSHFTNLKDCKSESLSETSTIINDDVEDPDEDEEDTADNEDVVHYFHREETPQNPNTNNVHTEDNPEHQISILKLRVLGM